MSSAGSQVVVLFGGPSRERLVSVASAQHVVETLGDAEPWFWGPDDTVARVTREALLAHARPFESPFVADHIPEWRSLEAAVEDQSSHDRIFLLALHGGPGEDGRLQFELEQRGHAFTGSASAASGTAFDKVAAREIARRRSIRVAPSIVLTGQDWRAWRRKLELFVVTHGRAVLKPVADGSSVGLHHLRTTRDLDAVLAAVQEEGVGPRLVEAFVPGREFTVGVVDGPNGPTALPISEVVVPDTGAFDYAGKYLGRGAREITPALAPRHVAHAVETVAVAMHKALGCEGYSRTDVIANGRGVTFLETNTLPGLTKASFLPQQLAAAGRSFEGFLRDQVHLARVRRDLTRRRSA